MKTQAKHTPMMQHYLTVKKKYPHNLVLYRLGDFYEFFFDDAKKASKWLNITLTHRGQVNGEPIPMAGVPVHAVDNYLAKLIKQGQSVVICDQVSQVSDQKGPIQREVTRVLTPGTVTDDCLLDKHHDNILLAIYEQKNQFGLARLDMSQDVITIHEVNSLESLMHEIARISPSEVLVIENASWVASLKVFSYTITERPSWEFDYDNAIHMLTQQFKTQNLSAFQCDHLLFALRAAGSLLAYIHYTHQDQVKHITSMLVEQSGDYLMIDSATRKHLELTVNLEGKNDHTLAWVMDYTETSMGSRLFKRWLHNPIRDVNTLTARHQAICLLKTDQRYLLIKQSLKGLADSERILARISLGTAKPRDLIQLRSILDELPNISAALAFFSEKHASEYLLSSIKNDLAPCASIQNYLRDALIDPAPATIRDGGMIAVGYDANLDDLKQRSEDSHQYLQHLEAKEKERTQISNLKIGYNRIHGYYIEISRHVDVKLPETYIRRQTLKNAERYVTPEIKNLEGQLLSAKSRALALEKECYKRVIHFLQESLSRLQSISKSLALLDVLANLAERAQTLHLTQPIFMDKTSLHIEQGRHLVIEQAQNTNFIPNNLDLGDEVKMLLITGPNMGGKSTYMRQAALMVLLAYVGSFVPAQSMKVGPIDRIFTRIGASDDLTSGRSTFMVEMTETASILRYATHQSLVIMDEIGRGTSTFDGLALAWACATELADSIKALTLFATHYLELTELTSSFSMIENWHLAAVKQKDKIAFLHQIRAGAANKSYGLEVARLAGVPQHVIKQALKKLHQLENQGKRKQTVASTRQVACFDSQSLLKYEKVTAFFKKIKPDEITPKEALSQLYQLKLLLKE